MPAPQPEELSRSAKQYFSNLGIKLPMHWKTMGPQFPGAFSLPELSTPANPSENLFHEPTLNKYHTRAARTLGRDYEKYIEGICGAIAEAIDLWMHSASIVSVELLGTIGTVLPEATIGPDLKSLILKDAPRNTQKEQDYSVAIATAVSDSWELWARGLTGILTYPPFGPPGPNIPAPLMTFASKGERKLVPEHLSAKIFHYLDDPGALHAKELFESIAQSIFINFQVFKSNSFVAGVIMTPPAPLPPPEPLLEGTLVTGDALAEEVEIPEDEEMAPEPRPIPGGVVIPTPGNFI